MEVHLADDTKCKGCDGCITGDIKFWVVLYNETKILLCIACLEELYWKIQATLGLE